MNTVRFVLVLVIVLVLDPVAIAVGRSGKITSTSKSTTRTAIGQAHEAGVLL